MSETPKPSAWDLAYAELTREIKSLEESRRDQRTRTTRAFVFLAAVAALAGTQLERVTGPEEALLFGLAIPPALACLWLIARAEGPWPASSAPAVKELIAREADITPTVLDSLRSARECHLAVISRAGRHLAAAEKVGAAIIAYVFVVALGVLREAGESDRGATTVTTAYLLAGLYAATAFIVVRTHVRFGREGR